MTPWTVDEGRQLYGIQAWGEGYFDINQQGYAVVRPYRDQREINLYEIVRSMVQRGINTPILVRFDGIIRDRVRRVFTAFSSAIAESNYQGRYQGVFPIKVNQQKHVVETIRGAGREFGLGLEVGSKPELVAVLALQDSPNALLLCNGYKDREYIELALIGRRLGRRSIIIVEQLSELEQILQISAAIGIEPELGIRIKPTSKGSGRWESSGGDRAKFGLSTSEVVTAIEYLEANGKKDWLKLLHFHAGSQITSITAIKKVLREATRMYTEVAKLCPSLCFFDVGGGLAVDYDGSKSNFHSSMDYSLEEYARDVVDAVQQACDQDKIPHPTLVSESGRALVAHHAVLVMQVIDVAPALDAVKGLERPVSDDKTLQDLWDLHENLSAKSCHEGMHDAISLREVVNQRFINGDLSLRERAYADRAFWHVMAKIRRVAKELRFVPEDIEKLDDVLKDTYFCNFSVFQSVPDSWAIDQLFPITPLHRLSEQPKRRCILADMSCDSDGKIERFIDLRDVKNFIPLHEPRGNEPYYLGVFLVGAYQEILGDLHNLFGDTNAVHVDFGENGEVRLLNVVEGDTVREALAYVQYEASDLIEMLRGAIEKSLQTGSLSNEDSARILKRYREALEGYTYLTLEP